MTQIPKSLKKIKALPQFKQFWGKHRVKVAVSGRASGKSVQAMLAAIFFMLKYKVKILQLRQFMNSISDSSYQQVVDLIEMCDLNEQFEIQKNTIICLQTGATMIFKGLERNIVSIKSMSNIDIVIVEEAESVGRVAWDILLPTIFRNEQCELWVLFNPKLPTDATAEIFLGDNPPEGTVLMRANYDQNPYLPASMLKDIQDMHDNDYQRYLHVYGGQFEDVGDSKVYPFGLVKETIGRTTKHVDVPAIGALDVARFGDDSSVLIVREGNEVVKIKSWKGLSSTELTRVVADEILGDGIKTLVIDNGGGHGSGPIDQLREQVGNVCKILEFHGAGKANDNRYINARAETYFLAKNWMATGNIPNDKQLIKELTSIEYFYNSKHQLQIEDKKQLKKRLNVSPDYADAFTMTFYIGARYIAPQKKQFKPRRGTGWN